MLNEKKRIKQKKITVIAVGLYINVNLPFSMKCDLTDTSNKQKYFLSTNIFMSHLSLMKKSIVCNKKILKTV